MTFSRVCVAAGALALSAGFVSTAAMADALYPSQLLADHPALQAQYDQMVRPVASQHAWVQSVGTETPIELVTLQGSEYAILPSCKPHDCAAERLVTLMTPGSDHAVGALQTNNGKGPQPTVSHFIWLGEPNARQRQFLAAYLLR